MLPEEVRARVGSAVADWSPAALGGDHLQEGARVVAAMSGGVDSSVATALLHASGFEVVGVSMRLGSSAARSDGHQGCCSLDDFEDARRVADKLDIPHYVVDLRDVFQEKIIDPFVSSYANGRTPNPCALCNRDVKFDAFWKYAEEVGAAAVGTGHYARIERHGEGFLLRTGLDPSKDQSYFLFTLGQAELARTLFPVGGMDKVAVREVAASLDLPVANKPESQDICFVAGATYSDFVETQLGHDERKPGAIVDQSGLEVGRHDGIHRFTVGQRRGLGGGAAAPRFVTSIDPDSATVVVGGRQDLLREEFWVDGVSWTDQPRGGHARVRLRHRHEPVACRVETQGRRARISFDTPTGGVSPGQAAVLYDDDRVLGGGWITPQ